MTEQTYLTLLIKDQTLESDSNYQLKYTKLKLQNQLPSLHHLKKIHQKINTEIERYFSLSLVPNVLGNI